MELAPLVKGRERDAVRADAHQRDSMNDSNPSKHNPVTDLSPAAVSVGRRLDRLPEGRYLMEFNKLTTKGEGWPLKIVSIKIVVKDDV